MTNRWFFVVLIFVGMLISYVDRTSLSIASGAIMHDLHLSTSLTGTLLSAFFWTYAGLQLPAGLLVDRFGVRWTYGLAFVLWSLASAGMALSRGFGDLLFLRLLLGMAETVGPLASLSLIRQKFSGAEQGLPTAIYVAGQTFGPACAALAGSILMATFGWRWMFAATGLLAILWVPLWFYAQSREKLFSAKIDLPKEKSPLPGWQILANKNFWIVSSCVFFFSYYWYFVLTWVPAYLSMSRHFSVISMGRTLSIPLFSMAAVSVVVGWIADKLILRTGNVFRVRLGFTFAGFFGAAFILLLNVFTGQRVVLPILIVSICSFGIASSNFWTLVQHASPAGLVARAIGYLNTISQLGGVVAPLITGWSLGPQRNFILAITLAGLAPLVSLILLLFVGSTGLENLRHNLSANEVADNWQPQQAS